MKGIAHLGEVFGFELSEVMAFGDSENDLEMLSGVGVGVAMGNGEDELKDQATMSLILITEWDCQSLVTLWFDSL